MAIRYTKRDREAIKSRFLRFRKKMLMTQAELAHHLGLNRASVSMIENGHQFPHRSTLKRFTLLENQTRTVDLRREYLHRRTNAGKDNSQTA